MNMRVAALIAMLTALPRCGGGGGELVPVGIKIDIRPAIEVRLVRTIARFENCVRWNNPGCLMYARQQGASRLASGYARFRTGTEGRLALEQDVRAKLLRGMTVGQILTAWNGARYRDRLLPETGLRSGDHW